MEDTQDTVTFAQAERALLRAVVECADAGDIEQAREAAQALVALRQALAMAGPAGGAASPATVEDAVQARVTLRG